MHRISNRRATAIAILLATILTVGVVTIWGMVCTIGTIVYSTFASSSVPVDQLVFTIEGEPLLQTWNRGYDSASYRKLDGTPIEDPDSVHLSETSYSELPPGDRSSWPGTDWAWRIVGFRQSRPTPVYWYLIQRGPDGPVYFAGYQAQSKQLIGYLGRGGFVRNVPPLDDQFVMPRGLFQNGMYAPARRGTPGAVPLYEVPESALFLAAGESLYKIDFGRQSVEPISMPDKVIAVGTYLEAKAVPDERVATYEQRLVVRMPDELQVMTLEGKPLRTVPLDRPMRDKYLSLTGTITDQVILETRGRDYWSVREFYWIGPDGDVTRHEAPKLYQRPSQDDPAAMWGMTCILPTPLVLTTFAMLGAALGRGPGGPSDFATAIAEIAAAGWLPFLLLLGVSLGLAVACYRRHRQIAPSEAVVWAAFVFLLGPPGWIGYWTHRRWPARARCEHCGAVVPRDRDACPACTAEFAAPALTGIEMFAQ